MGERLATVDLCGTISINRMNWIGWALLSALFAAATALLAKVGVAHVDSNLATALRTSVVVVFAWGIALTWARPAGRSSFLPPRNGHPRSLRREKL